MLIYSVVAAGGLVILLAMLLVGDWVGDHDASHDVGHGADGGGPSVFSTKIMAAFLTAFGVGGIVARYYGLGHPAASGVGVLAGVVMSSAVYQFAKVLFSQQASSALTMTGLVGAKAEVSIAIPAGGVGQVVLTVGGERTEHIARSMDGTPLGRGAVVEIMSVGGDAVVVRAVVVTVSGGAR